MILLKLNAPEVTARIQQGQYILLQICKNKRVPFFVSQIKEKTISITIASQDLYAEELMKLKKGHVFETIIGPLGTAIKGKELGNICIVVEGSGIGHGLLIAKEFKKFENRVYFIAGFKNKKQKYWEKEVSKVADKVFYLIERKNQSLTHPIIKEVHHLLRRKHIHLLVADCDLHVLKEIVHLSKMRTPVLASMLPLVKDSMGICGACRLTVETETKLCCLDGPFMNAHSLHWDEVLNRYDHQPPGETFCRKYSI